MIQTMILQYNLRIYCLSNNNQLMKKQCLNIQNKSGFTLIELLVVISIIGLLSSVVLASLGSAREKARNVKRLSDIKQYSIAFELAFDDNVEYPDRGNTSWACLGNYPDDACWGNNGTSVAENAALNSILDDYIPSLPIGGMVGNWEGYLYRCLTRVNDRCTTIDVRWFMEGINQSCGGETLLNANYSNLGVTYCSLTR